MAIITLADAKVRLEIPASDTSEDAAIQVTLDGVLQAIYDRTGYDPTATDHTDILEDAQMGRKYLTLHRPVDLAVAVTARARSHAGVASVSWTDMSIDVTDKVRGRFLLLGPSNFFQTFPPVEPPNPIFRWHQAIWPVFEVTYKTTAMDGAWPKDLVLWTGSLVMFAYKHSLSMDLVSASLDGISESYAGASRAQGDIVPQNIRAGILRHARRRISGWVP